MAKILIIDDETDINAVLCAVFKAAGHQVVSYEDHEDALGRVTQAMPDLIFLDVMMPGNPVAGFETCRMLKQDAKVKHIPIVVISAINDKYGLDFSGQGTGDDALPAAAFLEKPLEADDALKIVNELLTLD